MLIATAGHIDHGKTSLIRQLTRVDTDRLPQEKARGVSIDLGFAYHRLGTDEPFGFVDVPGHEKFIRNMLAGVGAIDAAMLVVAADDGPMPQTREHLGILDLLSVSQGVVAITKTDRVGPDRVNDVESELTALLSSTSLSGVSIVPVSNQSGDGIDRLRDELIRLRKQRNTPAPGGRLRLAIDRQFTIQGAGLVVTGAVFSGQIRVGDEVFVAPAGLPVRVRSLHIQDQPAGAGVAARQGDRCALNLTGLRGQSRPPVRGDWLIGGPAPEPTQRVDARLRVLQSENRPLTHWTPVHLHHGAGSMTGRVAILEGRQIAPGNSALVQLVLDQPGIFARGDRFVVRDQSASRTVAGGIVLDPFGAVRGRARAVRRQALEILETDSGEQALLRLARTEPAGVDLNRFIDASNLSPSEAGLLLQHDALTTLDIRARRIAVTTDRWQALRAQLLNTLAEAHQQHPDQLGPLLAGVRRVCRPPVAASLFDRCIGELVSDGEVVRLGAHLKLRNHQPTIPAAEQQLWSRVAPMLPPEQTRPPVVTALAVELGLEPAELDAALQRFAARGLLTRVVANRYFHPLAVCRLAGVAEQIAAGHHGEIAVRTYRDISGIGRNLTIEVLEYFDGQGFTRRIGESRRIIRRSHEVFGTGQSEAPD